MLHTERMASMGQIASVVAHELNNSLAGAIGCLELLGEHDRGDGSDLVKTALTELHRSAKIVTEIKSYARNDDDMDGQVDLPQLVQSLQSLIRYHRSASHDNELRLEVGGRHLFAENANQLLQALLNLVRNAHDAVADFQPAGARGRRRMQRVRDALEIDYTAGRRTAAARACLSRFLDQGGRHRHRARTHRAARHLKPRRARRGRGSPRRRRRVLRHAAGRHPERRARQRPRDEADPLACSSPPRPPTTRPHPENLRTDRRAPVPRSARRRRNAAIAQLDGAFDLVFLDVRMPKGGGPAVFERTQTHRPAGTAHGLRQRRVHHRDERRRRSRLRAHPAEAVHARDLSETACAALATDSCRRAGVAGVDLGERRRGQHVVGHRRLDVRGREVTAHVEARAVSA